MPLILADAERDRLMDITDRIMGSLRESQAAHEGAQHEILALRHDKEMLAARVADLEGELAESKTTVVDLEALGPVLDSLDAASAAVGTILGASSAAVIPPAPSAPPSAAAPPAIAAAFAIPATPSPDPSPAPASAPRSA